MAEWLSFEIPASMVGERREQKSQYVTTCQTEILLPKNSEYVGYHFWHSSKLVSVGTHTAKIKYMESFTFTLIKKDRESGRRYKRYTLTVDELMAVYRPETAKTKVRQEKKEASRRAQEGCVEAVAWERSGASETLVLLLHLGKKYYFASGSFFGTEKDVPKSVIVANGVQRGTFEDLRGELDALQEEYQLVQDVRCAVRKCNSYASNKVIAIGDSFNELCDKWTAEFCEKAAAIIRRFEIKLPQSH